MNRFTRQIWIGFLVGLLPLAAFGALSPKPTLVGKFVATNVQGSVSYISGGRVLTLKKGDTISATGTAIETSAHARVTLLFSNRTSLVLDESTRLRIETFDQEYFLRSEDSKSEPSQSRTTIELQTGRVAVSAPALRSGSSMVYRTSQADIAILAERVFIVANDQQTSVAVLSGSAAVRNNQAGGAPDLGVRLVSGQSIRIPTRVNFGSANAARPNILPALAKTSSAPSLAELDEVSSTLAATVRASIATSPSSAASIAAKAATSAPEKAPIITFAAVKAAPEQAPQIAFAVVQALNSSNIGDRSLRLKIASAVAAAATKAAPERAAFVTASAVQALLQNPRAPSSADERIELASTIAAAVAATAPGAASEITSATLAALTLVASQERVSNQQIVLSAARLASAIARVAGAESAAVGAAAVRWIMQTTTNLSESELVDAAGLIAAVAAQASPERAIAINTSIASAANLSLMTLQASAARSTAVAVQIGQQLGGLLQNAAFAGELASGLEAGLNGNPKTNAIVSDAVFRPDETNVAVTSTASPNDPTSTTDSFSPPQTTPFDPTLLGTLADDLAATQGAQDDLVFDVGTAPDGTPTVQPVPTVPATLPVEFVTSPANATG